MHCMPTHCGDVVVLGGAILLGGFLSEDGATITAITLTVSSALDPRIAFFSAFLGLWIGDLGVYMLARSIGPSIMRKSWVQKWFACPSHGETAQTRSDGRLGLAVSRFFPGTRVAAYVSAALGRMPANVFAVITAVSAFLWVALIFAVIRFAPARVATAAQQHLPAMGFLGLVFFLVLHLWRKWGVWLRQWLGITLGRICHEVQLVCSGPGCPARHVSPYVSTSNLQNRRNLTNEGRFVCPTTSALTVWLRSLV